FQGERRNGRFYPDHVTRMSTTNHYGYLHRPEGWHRRMSRAGEVEWEDGTDTLVRAGPGTKAYTRAAPFLPTWADAWWHLTIDVDTAAQTVRYRMIPEDPADGRGDLADRIITIGPDFFPADSLAAAFSLHWLDREGRLEASLWLQADWFYHTPVTGLSDEEVLEQVALLQERGLDRVHTAGGPLFEDRSRSAALRPRITGPAQAACGRPATWTLDVAEGGTRYVVDYRYRVRRADGRLGPWQPVYAPSFTLTPRPGQAGVEIEAEVQDLWAPHGVVEGYGGWQHPHPNNQRAHVHHAAAFACGTG
ncbi:MAG: hypothetical protein R3362_09345, partial [Rhodothermales bacterium]|nr:hypothetical protein [Rhodothermales bacterium]